MRIITLFATLIILLTSLSANASIPSNLIALDSPTGTQFFERSYSSAYFWPLDLQFVTQENRTYCSIASSVMVLNALGIQAPHDPIFAPFKIFTQANFFTPAVEKILPSTLVKKQGSTLKQISQALMAYPVTVKVMSANTFSVAQFRTIARKVMLDKSGYIIVNFLRTGLKEEGGGHMSPLAAYDPQSDRFLLLDVARYRYPSVWVKTEELWNAMHTFDHDAKAYRGFIIVCQQNINFTSPLVGEVDAAGGG